MIFCCSNMEWSLLQIILRINVSIMIKQNLSNLNVSILCYSKNEKFYLWIGLAPSNFEICRTLIPCCNSFNTAVLSLSMHW